MREISDDAKRNRTSWTKVNAEFTDREASSAWAATEMTWGVFGVPEATINTLGDVNGLDVIELGCGSAYVSAWLAKRGARPVGVDVTPAQLATARRCQIEFGMEFRLIEASAEDVPLPSESFDLAISEFGARIWCDPHAWLPEAHRLLHIVDLVELYPSRHAAEHSYYVTASLEWAHKWPYEEIWVVAKSP
jgi:SAM-dependent methyltransferase